MPDSIEKAFDKNNFEKIKQAVAAAESGTSGEIVPCIVDQSSDYEEASGKVFFYTVAIVAFGLALYEWKFDLWLPQFKMSVPLFVILILLSSGAISFVAIHWLPSLKRILLGKQRMLHATNRQAKLSFFENEVFRTKNRTGILIFVSLFEHHVQVMADKGLHETVTIEKWNEVVNLIIAGIKQGNPSKGIIDGIEKCGEILRKYSPRTFEDSNELPDDLHIGKFKE